MSRFRLQAGATISYEGSVWRIVERLTIKGVSGWLVKCLATGQAIYQAEPALQQAYLAGKLARHHDPGELTGLAKTEYLRRRSTPFNDLSEGEKKLIRARRRFIKYVLQHAPPGATSTKLPDPQPEGGPRTVLQAIICDGAKHAELKRTPSVATYFRWKAHLEAGDDRALMGRLSERGNRQRVHPLVRERVMAAFVHLLDQALDVVGSGGRMSITGKKLAEVAETVVAGVRLQHPGLELKVPRAATLSKWWTKLPAVQRDTVRLGVIKAKHEYRQIRGHVQPTEALEEVEYDETTMPFMFVDEDTLLALGRGTLGWFLDVVCHSVNGWYLGFEPASDLMMMSAAKHMVLPKAYVADEYPSIKSPLIHYGYPGLIRVDNSRPAWGRTAEELCSRIDCDWDWCPTRTPYFKPIVEGMFRILNSSLIDMLPGAIFPRLLGRTDYDPAKNAVIGIRHFLLIFHTWLAEVYHPSRQAHLGASPNELFLRDVARKAPGLPDRAADIRINFGVIRDGRRLDHKGVVYEGLYYRSEELQQLRLDRGHTQKVEINVDPSNINEIFVRPRRDTMWIKATSARPEYTAGRSLHQHQLIRNYEREHLGTDGSNLFEAERALRALIAESADDAISIQRNKLVARFEGIGTDNIFANLGLDGRLGSLAGPFTGLRLNPLVEAGGTTPSSVPAGQGSSNAKLRGSVRVPGTPDGLPEAGAGHTRISDESADPPRRSRKTFRTDRSLGKDCVNGHEE
jgi:hypothetical protein